MSNLIHINDMVFRKKVKILCALFGVLIAAVTFPACQEFQTLTNVGHTLSTPNESVVVNAEKTLRISKDTFDLFLRLEYENRDLVKQRFPQVHSYAEYIRKNAPDWLINANNIKNAYKHGTIGLDQLQSALAVITSASSKAQQYIKLINGTP